MPDDFFANAAPPVKPRGGSVKVALMATLIAFLLGAGAAGYAAWAGLLPFVHREPDPLLAGGAVPNVAATSGAPIATASTPANALLSDSVAGSPVETRVAALEQRLADLDLRAEAASGNAARAEGLLVAFAARRALDRGVPLGYLEDQLKLRFADAQPNAVQAVTDAARQPVTLDQLSAGLDALTPRLIKAPASAGAWGTLKREFSGLFVVKRDSAPGVDPAERLARARLDLTAGKTDAAIAEVQRLPGAGEAGNWIAAARRYDMARRALDLIETTALLENRTLKNGEGQRVVQPGLIGATE
ncbi:MAG: hypothetical protein ABI673_10615 [Novosphingobium sp.]